MSICKREGCVRVREKEREGGCVCVRERRICMYKRDRKRAG